MNRMNQPKEMQGKAGTCGPGPVANKPPAQLKASPRKKLAMGAKDVVKGKR